MKTGLEAKKLRTITATFRRTLHTPTVTQSRTPSAQGSTGKNNRAEARGLLSWAEDQHGLRGRGETSEKKRNEKKIGRQLFASEPRARLVAGGHDSWPSCPCVFSAQLRRQPGASCCCCCCYCYYFRLRITGLLWTTTT